jgi:hypothetical protein
MVSPLTVASGFDVDWAWEETAVATTKAMASKNRREIMNALLFG